MRTNKGLVVKELLVDRGRFKLKVPALRVRSGEVCCVVGANGSGKTTLLECIVGIMRPTQGTVSIAGQSLRLDIPSSKKRVGYIPDDDGWVINELTGSEFIRLLGRLYGNVGVKQAVKTASEIAASLSFIDYDKQIGSLSHGNKKKLQIIAGLMHRPRFLVVDELRNGLDPIAIKQAEGLIHSFARAGTTILAATHDLWWAQRLADKIVVLHQGEIILEKSTRSIVKEFGSVELGYMEVVYEHAK